MTEAGSHGSARIRTRSPKGELVLPTPCTDPDLLQGWFEDAAHYAGGSSPELFTPCSEGEVAAVLLRGRPCLAVGAQSSLTGGATPAGQSLISMAQFCRFHEEPDGLFRVGAGLVLREFQQQLQRRGRYYPPAPTFDGATVGGNVATNAAGAATFAYGTTRDWVVGLTVVLACGEVLDLIRGQNSASSDGTFEIEINDGTVLYLSIPEACEVSVPKNSCGYYGRAGMDLIDLLIGAEGTLGVITEVVLRTVSPCPSWCVVLVALDSDAQAVALTSELRDAARRGVCRVTAIEYMDRSCIELIRDHASVVQCGIANDDDVAAYLLIQVELPAGTTAEVAGSDLALAFDDDDRGEAGGDLAVLGRILRQLEVSERTVVVLPGEEAKRAGLFAVREAVPEAVNSRVAEYRNRSKAGISKSSGDLVVPFEVFGAALARYRELLEAANVEYAIWGHISDGNVHPNIMARSDDEMQVARELQLELGRVAIQFGGAPMAEHGTGRNPIKQQLLAEFQGPRGLASMKALRRVLDPKQILAAGVLWPTETSESSA